MTIYLYFYLLFSPLLIFSSGARAFSSLFACTYKSDPYKDNLNYSYVFLFKVHPDVQ